MVATYKNALHTIGEKAKGLTTTNQGGEAYEIDELKQLERYVLLGTLGGTFYIDEKKLTMKNIEAVQRAIDTHGTVAVDRIVAISEKGRAPNNDPALLALAIAASAKNADGSPNVALRTYALRQLPRVARIGTHLFHFCAYIEQLRGWGAGLRKAVANWYTTQTTMQLAKGLTKYAQRDGWSHKDVLTLAHPIPKNGIMDAIFHYVVEDELPPLEGDEESAAIAYLRAIEFLHKAAPLTDKDAAKIIADYGLPREVVPTHMLNSPIVWEALLMSDRGMPVAAMVRNLGKMSEIGLLTQGSDASRFVMDRLDNQELITASRIHPIDVLKAKFVYGAGKGVRSDKTWTPVNAVVQALERAFYNAFGNVEPTGKRLVLALDVSGSMTFGEGRTLWEQMGALETFMGIPGFSPRIATAALCLVTARVERDYEIFGFGHTFVDLKITGNDSLEDAMRKVQHPRFMATDCCVPMQYAMKNNWKADAFIVYTDNETGYANPSDTMREYRKKSGIHDAKLIVNAMTANNFSIADPTDPNMLDVVGFDTAAPQVVSEFIRG